MLVGRHSSPSNPLGGVLQDQVTRSSPRALSQALRSLRLGERKGEPSGSERIGDPEVSTDPDNSAFSPLTFRNLGLRENLFQGADWQGLGTVHGYDHLNFL